MNAEIIAIGDEITSGQLLDTNTQWLSKKFESLGVRVLYHSTVGDELPAMIDVFRTAIQRADLIVVTGGLGPTADDLTREALAHATDRELELRPDVVGHIRQMFERRGRVMPESNVVQAMFPVGSRMIDNPNGTAPGIELATPRDADRSSDIRSSAGRPDSYLFALPGVPAEMREMWRSTVEPRVRELGGGQQIVYQYKVNCFGAGESQIESMLPDMIRRGRVPRVGITASDATIILRITAEGASEADCQRQVQPTIDTIHKRLGDLVYGYGDQQLQDAVAEQLGRQGRTLAVVEWGTAGMINQWMASSSEGDGAASTRGCYLGGLTVQTLGAVDQLFGILPVTVVGQLGRGQSDREQSDDDYRRCTLETVQAMALRGRELMDADLCLAVGPFPSAETLTGDPLPFHLAIATRGDGPIRVQSHPHAGHPALLTTLAAKRALNMVRTTLLADHESSQASPVTASSRSRATW